MRLFYDPHISADQEFHYVSEEESKHIVRVLRMQEGDQFRMLNGKGDAYTCQIDEAHAKKCRVRIVNHQHDAAPDYEIHIAVSPTKQLDRMEWFVEKATEIGVTAITFLQCQNSERVKLKLDRLERKAISAMKQSHRTYLPVLNDLTNCSEFIAQHPNGLLAHCEDGDKQVISNVFTPTSCPILIGPEGDFSRDEINLAAKHGYKLITLGENRLRTETAALFACMQARIMTT